MGLRAKGGLKGVQGVGVAQRGVGGGGGGVAIAALFVGALPWH